MNRRLCKSKYYYLFLKDFDSVLDAYIEEIDNFFFIQIGANDGIMCDPINKFIKRYKWRGILVEPQKKEFKKLKKNYKNKKGLIFENAAISSKNEIKKLYKLSDNKIKENWQRGIASFVPKKGDLDKFDKKDIDIEKVNCITFSNLINKHRVKNIDLLQIDVEGYDYDIIKLINLNRIKPKIINYENEHLTNKERNDCARYLQKKGYIVIEYGSDTVAFLNGLFEIKSVIVK